MSQTIIIVDSHQLSEFQRCPRLYSYAQVQQFGSTRLKDALVKGTGLHNMLYLFYKARIQKHSVAYAMKKVLSYMRFQRKMTIEHIQQVQPKILQYIAHYQNETWKPLAAEIGFSKVLYEDSQFKFIYEGKIDLLMEVQGIKAFVDHKSQSRHRNLPQDSNQFLGYAWATGFKLGIINFLNLAPSLSPKDAFRREICNYSTALVDEWKEGAIETCIQMARAREANGYKKQRQGCLGVYGLCDFEAVCKQTSQLITIGMLQRDFVKKDKWEPWSLKGAWEILSDND